MRRPSAILATALLVVACGSRARLSKAQYERQLSSIGTKAGTALTRIFTDPAVTHPSSLTQVATVVQQGATTVDDAGTEIERLHPPAGVDDENANLAKGFHELADELRRFADDADRGDVAAVQAFDQQVTANRLPGEQLIQRSIDALKRQGYRIGSA